MRVSRRTFLEAAAFGLVAAPLATASPRLPDGLFRRGVASGTPSPDGVLLWTRLAPEPFDADGGMPARPIPVRWEVALDERFRRVVGRGVELARPEDAHSVHVDVRRLRPGYEYWFRFRAGRDTSPTGRTSTLPEHADAFAFAFVSCQRYEHGHLTAHRALAADDLDLVVHLGDYIYENAIPRGSTPAAPRADLVPDAVRPEATDLAGYRLRHALYKTDPDLQAAHARIPWAVILDNHDAVWDGDPA